MANFEYAKLILKTSDLPTGDSNQIGSCDANRTSFVWNNVDLRNILGSLYDKYDTFNLNLNTFASSLNPTILYGGTTGEDRQLTVLMKGLPFINSTYNCVTGNNTGTTTLGSIYFVAGQTTYQTFNNNFITFAKNQEKCNISINYTRILDDTSPATNNPFPQVVFYFDIVGVKEKVKDKNGSRISN